VYACATISQRFTSVHNAPFLYSADADLEYALAEKDEWGDVDPTGSFASLLTRGKMFDRSKLLKLQ
jgi:hypothetical protein